jgi:hypothetical protein
VEHRPSASEVEALPCSLRHFAGAYRSPEPSRAAFFGELDQIMRNDVVLAITRMTDPPRTGRGKRENASLGRLIEMLAPDVGATELTDWQSHLAVLNAAVEPLRDARNRFLAHDDLATVLDYQAQPWPDFSRADVEALLERIPHLFESIEEKFLRSHPSRVDRRGRRTAHRLAGASCPRVPSGREAGKLAPTYRGTALIEVTAVEPVPKTSV